jgi:hypothetical protein
MLITKSLKSLDMLTYFEITANSYEKSYYRKTGTVLQAQGFRFADDV